MKWDWDVKDAMPYTMKMKTINFMAYMFHNSPYRITMDGPLAGLMRRLSINAQKLPPRLDRGARSKKFEIKNILITQFDKIYRIATKSGAPVYTLREFYETPYRDLSKEQQKILQLFEELYEPRGTKKHNEFAHFCMPFIAIQQASKSGNDSLLVKAADMNYFLGRVGHLTILDLYTVNAKLYTKEEVEGVKKGYDFGILQYTQSTSSSKGNKTILTPPPGNGMKCEDGECVDGNVLDWCTEDSEGHCTIGG